jgi:hypothetical protein
MRYDIFMLKREIMHAEIWAQMTIPEGHNEE